MRYGKWDTGEIERRGERGEESDPLVKAAYTHSFFPPEREEMEIDEVWQVRETQPHWLFLVIFDMFLRVHSQSGHCRVHSPMVTCVYKQELQDASHIYKYMHLKP